MGTKRSLALSDLHLGRSNSRLRTPEQLASLLEGFDEVLFLGDTIDHWYLSAHEVLDLESRVIQICRDSGVGEIHWFRGNHDAGMQKAYDIRVFQGILYLHGHALYHRLKGPGSASERIERLNARKFGSCRLGSRKDHPVWELIEEAYRRIPQAVARPLAWTPRVRRRLKALVQEVAGGDEIKAVVFGHDHCPGVRQTGNLHVYNLGGWMENTQACAFVQEEGSLKLLRITNKKGRPRFGKVLHELQA